MTPEDREEVERIVKDRLFLPLFGMFLYFSFLVLMVSYFGGHIKDRITALEAKVKQFQEEKR